MVNLDEMQDRERVSKKKKNKRKLEEAVEETALNDENQVLESADEAVKPKKKKKKKNREAVESETVETLIEKVDEQTSEISPFKKDFYTMSATTEAMGKKEVKAFRQLHNITLYGKGRKEFKPLLSFEEVGFPPAIMNICAKFQKPSPIQVSCLTYISWYNSTGTGTVCQLLVMHGIPVLINDAPYIRPDIY
jgi:ATP-dependent RNA helicase DBP3